MGLGSGSSDHISLLRRACDLIRYCGYRCVLNHWKGSILTYIIGVIRVKGQSQVSLRIWTLPGVIKMESTDWLTCRLMI